MGDSHSSGGPRGGGNRNNNRNRNRNRNRSGGGGGNRNRGGRNRSENNNEWKPSGNRGPRKPEPKPTFFQKLLGFFGMGKKAASAQQSGKNSKRGSRQGQGNRSERPPRKKREHTPVEVTSGRLFVGNLDYKADEAALKAHFEKIGPVKTAEIVMNPHNGKPKGFAFVEMESMDDAKKAVAELHEKDFLSRRLLIGGAKSRGPRTGDGEDRRSGGRERSERRERSPRDGNRGGGDRGGDRNERGGGRNRREKPKPQHADSNDPAMKPIAIETVTSPALQLGNLSDEFTAEDLTDLLEGIGTLASSEISEGTAAIVMSSTEEAQRAVELLHAKDFMGQRLSVTGSDGEAPAPTPTPEPVAEEVETVQATEAVEEVEAAPEVAEEEN